MQVSKNNIVCFDMREICLENIWKTFIPVRRSEGTGWAFLEGWYAKVNISYPSDFVFPATIKLSIKRLDRKCCIIKVRMKKIKTQNRQVNVAACNI